MKPICKFLVCSVKNLWILCTSNALFIISAHFMHYYLFFANYMQILCRLYAFCACYTRFLQTLCTFFADFMHILCWFLAYLIPISSFYADIGQSFYADIGQSVYMYYPHSMPISCRLYADSVQTLCAPYAGFMQIMLILCRLYSEFMLI